MFHIFNKAYVESDTLINHHSRQVNISRHTGFQKLIDPSQPNNPQGQIAFAQSIEDLGVEKFGELLVNLANSQESTTIFADSEAYTRIFSIVIKAMFPAIDLATFKRLFLCRKVSFDSYAVNVSSYLNGYSQSIEITLDRVVELFSMVDPYVDVYQEFLKTHNVGLSLEWRTIKFLQTGDVGTIPDTLSNLCRKTAIRTGQEALLEWGRLITDDVWTKKYDLTVDELLQAPTAARACKAFDTLNSKLLSESNAVKMRVSDLWLEDLCGEAAEVLKATGEVAMADRTIRLGGLISRIPSLSDPVELRAALVEMFSNETDCIRTSVEDANKIDENIIRFALKLKDKELAKLMKGSEW